MKTRPPQQRRRSATDRFVAGVSRWLNRYSIDALRLSLGLTFLVFGAIKFTPGGGPAADLATRTIETLSLGIVPGPLAVIMTAVVECFIGLTLLTAGSCASGSWCWRRRWR